MAKAVKTIGVLTSGGDAPGMNAAIRAVVRAGIRKGMEVYGVYRGYNGLINGAENDGIKILDVRSVSDVIQRGGTFLYTARCAEFREEPGILKAVKTCHEFGIEGMVVIGGDGSFRGAADLSAHGIPCIGLPGTIDNDIAMTEYTIGYDTAMNTAMELIDKLRDTASSHDRCSVVEVMGRRAGYIALNTGIACGATAIITTEVPFNIDAIVEKINKTHTNNKHHFIVVISEGIGNAQEIAREIEEKTGVESRATILGHVQRGGAPTVRDRVEASKMGYYAVELLEKGVGNRVVGLKDGKVIDVDIQEALRMKKEFPKDLYKIADEISF